MKFRASLVTTLGLLTLISGVAHADPRQDMLESIAKCSTTQDDKARLGCYDALSPRLHDAVNVPPETLSHPPTADEQKSWFGFNLDGLFGTSPAQQTTPQQFGADKIAPPAPPATSEGYPPEVVDSIQARVTDYSFTLSKRFIVFLDNGQVWRQIPGDVDEAYFKRIATDNTVMIDRGLMGSYNMTLNDSAKTFKVTRVK